MEANQSGDMLRQEMQELIQFCCDRLIEAQVTAKGHPDEGGIWCKGCGTVHGRSGDAVFPLYYMYLVSGKARYREAAKRLLLYISRTQEEDGGWRNEPESDWKGTTVFQLLALCHAYDQLTRFLADNSDYSDEKTDSLRADSAELLPLIASSAQWVSNTFGDGGNTNINYYLSSALALHLADRIVEVPQYSKQAKQLMHHFIDTRLSYDGWLYGEKTRMRPFTQMTSMIDIGYNLDMSIGAMAEYARLTNDSKVMAASVHALAAHMNMMYPDGSIDNSFGSRNYKWTLFGSKTAHGSQMAFMLLANEHPAFLRAAELNTSYLKRSLRYCDGLFGYGPMHEQMFEHGCIHSTINRSDALSVAIAYATELCSPAKPQRLPSEESFGARSFKELAVIQLRKQKWMATVSCTSVRNAPTGGAISYLWHEEAGPIQLGAMTSYRLYEAYNMPQALPHMDQPITPRIELMHEGRAYSNLYEHDAHGAVDANINKAEAAVNGSLKAVDNQSCYDCAAFYSIRYSLEDDAVIKHYELDIRLACDRLSIIEPILTAGEPVCKASRGQRKLIADVLEEKQLELTYEGESFVLDEHSLTARAVSIFPSAIAVPLRWDITKVTPGVYSFQIRMLIKS